MTLDQYVAKLNTLYQTGNAREHSYRGDLQNLIMAIIPDVLVTNEPARVACGAPDYVLTRKDVPLGYIEAKDIGVDLKSKSLKEQFDRYKNGLSNLIFTDYLDFHFYRDGEFVTSISIAELKAPSTTPSNASQFSSSANNNASQFPNQANNNASQFSSSANNNTSQFPNQSNVSGSQFSSSANNNASQFSNQSNNNASQNPNQANNNASQFPNQANNNASQFSSSANNNASQFSTQSNVSASQFPTKSNVSGSQFPSSGGVPNGRGGSIVPKPENYAQFTTLLINFAQTISQTIKSPTKLAQMMAGKARLMADVIEKTLHNDDEQNQVSALKGQMLTFKQMLIHDIDNKSFSDIYSQTIAYGMFAARYHDPSLPTFSRQEAATLIPRSNPFLRKLFQDIASYDLDHRLVWIVDDLVSIFLASDVATIMKNFGKSTKQEDPVVHFYETFLGEYNPALRKARGVWYTPQPVVNFIVRAVDEVLKTEFGLKDGLADTSKTKIKVKTHDFDNRSKNKSIITGEKVIEKEVHRVQVLDPATGTGTFLAEVVKHIYKKFEGQQGIWSNYVKNDLIPRLNGFELLMASYAMAHLKMDMLLTETGYTQTTPPDGHPSKGGEFPRLKIFLTNSLEEASDQQLDLFNWLADEANQANAVKKEAPVMVVIGNPPYSGESANKGEWIMNLMEDYKKEPGSNEKLKERNPKWINDDYVKFMRFGQHFIEKNGEGILAFINPHGFLDNPTFRGMRWNLLKTYDKIYTIDLHGNSKKKETAEDGSVDQNVFDIMQGVSINIMVKTGKKKTDELGQVYHYDLYGKREYKYNFLAENSIKTIGYQKLENVAPNYFMVYKNFEEQNGYDKGFLISDLMVINSVGIVTSNDSTLINGSKEELITKVKSFYNNEIKINLIKNLSYRPFDNKKIYFDLELIERGRDKVMKHFYNELNIGLVLAKQCVSDWRYVFVSKFIGEFNLTGTAGRFGSGSYFPLYLYPDNTGQQNAFDEQQERIPNLDATIAQQIAKGMGATYVPELDDRDYSTPPAGWDSELEIGPLAILDYIYAVLHSPSYRATYNEFLKIDFPRVPYPTDKKAFWALVALGTELRQLHLLESDTVERYITRYPIDGDNVVGKPRFEITSTASTAQQSVVNVATHQSPLTATAHHSALNVSAHNSPPLEGCPQDGVVHATTTKPPYFLIHNTKVYHNTITELPYNPKLKERAKALRYAENLSEVLFWKQVHKGNFHTIDFDRQRIIGNYIVDFYVKKLGLVVEIDGASHDTKVAYDQEREAYLNSLGLIVFRIPVVDVLQNMTKAINDLEAFIVEQYGEKEDGLGLERLENGEGEVLEEPPRPTGTPPKEGNYETLLSDGNMDGNLEESCKMEMLEENSKTLSLEKNLGRVYINDTQYFDGVPEVAWNFYIGGYQPAQKWLKDRKGRTLTYEDIFHYQKMIVAMTETSRIMTAIDAVRV